MTEKIKKNNVIIALNALYAKKRKKYCAYISKDNSNREKQVIPLMIPNGEKREVRSEGLWHYLAVHKLSALLTGITSKYQGNFCCLNCIHSFATEKKTKKVCESKDFSNVFMPSEDPGVLELNQC